MYSLLQAICELHNLQYKSATPLSGGDINTAYAVETTDGRFFIKLNSATSYPQMFAKEADGLKTLQQATTLKVPSVVAHGEIQKRQYLILEWLEKSSPSSNFWERFAEGLVQLHKTTHCNFGWPSSNYIGSLIQINQQTDTWAEFYATQRIMPLVKRLFDEGNFSKADVEDAESLCKNLEDVFPKEPPSLIHGDLWAGNYMAVKSADGNIVPSIYDPAAYYSHREMDIGMSRLFGGFNSKLYEIYHSLFPLANEWRKRVSLTQLYPLLVHAILFGGGYISQCRNILTVWK